MLFLQQLNFRFQVMRMGNLKLVFKQKKMCKHLMSDTFCAGDILFI